MNWRACSLSVAVAVHVQLLTPPSAAGQEPPRTREGQNAGKSGSRAKPPPPPVGAQFRDNPPWLQQQLDAEEALRRQKEEAAADAAAVDEKEAPGYIPGYRRPAALGLSPLAPQHGVVIPGAITPNMGAPVRLPRLRFDFHGYLQAGVRAGLGTREDPGEQQARITLHGDPLVPGGAFGWFEHTNTVPVPWAQLNFLFGNDVVRATAIIAAWSITQSDLSAEYFQPPSKVWFNDAYITYTPQVDPVDLNVNVGVFTERYGAMGEYDNGAYGTSLIGVVYGVGGAGTVVLPFDNDFSLAFEGGFKGDLNTPGIGLISDQSNEFARSIEGSTYAGHGHASIDYDGVFEANGHAIYAWSRDDRGDELEGRDLYLGDLPRRDGSLLILGLDGRYVGRKRYGHLYVGASHVIGRDAITVSNLVQVLNNGPGRDMSRRFWGFDSGGNGSLTLAGAQYNVSLGALARRPAEFLGDAPDFVLSLFGIYGYQRNTGTAFPDAHMAKVGTEGTYSILPWLAASTRFDAVAPDFSDMGRFFAVVTPKVLFRSGWDTRASLTLQYSAYILGDSVEVRGDERLLNNPSGNPDAHLLALYGTIWW